MDEYFEVEFNCSNKTYFGYLESKDITMYIFVQDEDYESKKQISDIIAREIAANFMLNSIYDIENIKKIIYKTSKMLEREKIKNRNLQFSNASLLLLLTDKTTFFVVSIGNIRLTQLRNNKVIYVTRLDNLAQNLYQNNEIEFDEIVSNKYRNVLTNSIGGLDALKINYSGELDLKAEDELIIEGINSWQKDGYDLENSDIAKIKILKVNEILSDNKKGYLKYTYFVIVIILVLLYLLNSFRINKYTSEINLIKNNLKIYKKNVAIKSVSKELMNLEREYSNMRNAFLLYIPRKIEVEKAKDELYIQNTKDELKELEIISEKIANAKIKIQNYEYEKAKEIFEELKLKNNTLFEKDINEGLNKANMFIKAKEDEIKADEYLENKDYKKAINIYNSLMQFYFKNEKVDYTDKVLKNKLENAKLNMQDLIDVIYKKLDEFGELKKVNLSDSRELIKDVYEMATKIEDKDLLDKIENEQELLAKEIENELLSANALRQEGLNYLKNKNYRASLESLLESNIRFRKINLDEDINENEKTIRKVRNIIKSFKKPTIVRDDSSSKKELELKILKSIYLSIDKGDEFMMKNKFSDALEEYKRALNFTKKVKIPNASLKKLQDKIKYAESKMDSRWF